MRIRTSFGSYCTDWLKEAPSPTDRTGTYDADAAVQSLAAAATLTAAQGDPLHAAQLFGCFKQTMRQLGLNDVARAGKLLEVWLPRARESLNPAAWKAAWDIGTNLDPERALELAAHQP